ncbi:MAG TPA: hypothetical protein VNX28_17295, partial [Gemmataceae bacterium]|nr:hypothetical protein [Gemmataceae bacterium]
MWELISFAAGMVVLLLLFALLPHVFDLPDAIMKYFSKRSWPPRAGLPPRDSDEAAARVLGESLERAELSSEAAAQITAAFWAANDRNRRALAHMVAGMSVDGPVEDEDVLLAMLRSLPATSESPTEGDKKPSASTDFRELP